MIAADLGPVKKGPGSVKRKFNLRSQGRSYSCRARMGDVVACETKTRLSLPLAYEVYSKFGDRTIGAKAFSGSIGNAEALAIKSMYTSS